MSNDDRIDEDMEEIELPPALAKLVDDIEKSQKQLLKDKRFAAADQLKQFVGLHLMELISTMVKMFGTTMFDTHQLAVSNARQLQNMKRWTSDHLRTLGADVGNDDAFAGVGTEEIDALGQRLYALGSHLQVTYPNDVEATRLFNNLVVSYNDVLTAMMGYQRDGDDDEEEDEEEEGEEHQADGGDDRVVDGESADATAPGESTDGGGESAT